MKRTRASRRAPGGAAAPRRRGRRPYRVARSGIHGHGVFATEPIRKGTRLLEYTGELVSAEEAERRAARSDHVYIFDLENGSYIDGDPRSDAAHVNHSCDPNCVIEIEGHRVFIDADRDIRPGEELTYDYSFDADTDIWSCRCNAGECRGTINVVDEESRRRVEPERARRRKTKRRKRGRGGKPGKKKRKGPGRTGARA